MLRNIVTEKFVTTHCIDDQINIEQYTLYLTHYVIPYWHGYMRIIAVHEHHQQQQQQQQNQNQHNPFLWNRLDFIDGNVIVSHC